MFSIDAGDVYIILDGQDTVGCGTIDSACKTLSYAFDNRIRYLVIANVYLDGGQETQKRYETVSEIAIISLPEVTVMTQMHYMTFC